MSYTPLNNDELAALKTLIRKQFFYHNRLVIDILKNQSLVCCSVAINGSIFFELPSLLAKLPKSTVEVSLQGARIVMTGKVVDILGVTQHLAENACLLRSHRVGSFLCTVSDTAKQV